MRMKALARVTGYWILYSAISTCCKLLAKKMIDGGSGPTPLSQITQSFYLLDGQAVPSPIRMSTALRNVPGPSCKVQSYFG
jgi:hypothetical protein